MEPHGVDRRGWLKVTTGAVASLAVPVVLSQQITEKIRLNLALDQRASLMNLPLLVAESLGYLDAEGLEVNWQELGSPQRVQQALSSAAADATCAPYQQALAMHSRGVLVRSVVIAGRTPQCVFGVSTRSLPNYRRLSDLRGARVGVPELGSSEHLAALSVAVRGGLRSADLLFVPVGHAAGLMQALRTAQVDAICHVDPAMTQLEQRGEVRVIADMRTLRGTSQALGGPMPSAAVMVQEEFLRRNPMTCQQLVNAIVHALKWLQSAGPSDIIKTVPEAYFSGDRALYLASFGRLREAISPDGLLVEEAARTAYDALAMVDPAVRTVRLPLERTYTNELARRAKARFNA